MVCIALTLVMVLGMRSFLILIHTPEEVLEESYAYIRVICTFIVVMFIYNLCSGILRAIGNSVMPLIFLIFSSVMNIVLDIVMISVFRMGVVGTAIATVVAQGISSVLCIIYILSRVPLVIPETSSV
jgi:Na+-driven multidrug efflux pump